MTLPESHVSPSYLSFKCFCLILGTMAMNEFAIKITAAFRNPTLRDGSLGVERGLETEFATCRDYWGTSLAS